MGIQAVLENLDDVQEELRKYYKEDAEHGIFAFDLDKIDEHPKVRGVVSAYKKNTATRDKLKTENDELKARLSSFPEDFDPDSYQEMLNDIEKNTGPDVEDRMAKLRAKLQEKHDVDIQGRDDKIGKLDSAIRKMVVDDGLGAAMDEAQIDTKHKSKLLPYLKAMAKIAVEEDGEAFIASVDTDLGHVSLKQFVTEWAASEDGKEYVAKSTGPKPRGGNGAGNSGTVTRAEFDAMSHADRAKTAQDGVQVVDA